MPKLLQAIISLASTLIVPSFLRKQRLTVRVNKVPYIVPVPALRSHNPLSVSNQPALQANTPANANAPIALKLVLNNLTGLR